MEQATISDFEKLDIRLGRDPGGKVFDPEYFENMATIKDWGKGGRGIFLMKEFMDIVQYIIYPNNSTLLYLSKQF